MKLTQANRNSIYRLGEIRNRFDAASSREKLELLHSLHDVRARTPTEVTRLHAALCFIRAFPDSLDHYRHAQSHLAAFQDRVASLSAATRDELWDTGIVGTQLNYRFSYEVATWLATRCPGLISIDWEEYPDSSHLEALLPHLMQASESDHFDSGVVDCRDWLEMACGSTGRTDFDWLIAQLNEEHLSSVWAQMYNAADLPLIWQLSGAGNSMTLNTMSIRRLYPRANGMRRGFRAPKKEIMRPLESLQILSPRAGAAMIDVAMMSLAVRHRETNHFNYANRREVYLADVGEGISVAVFGIREKHRYPLECTMGFLILSNGVPIGYGGSSALFRQVNTGINIFDEYRGSEAAFLWVQVMRVYRQLTGCTRFIANPYQIGGENTEALKSGAFWFYYKLGYRPVLPSVRKLATREWARLQRSRTNRSDLKTMKRLVSCDMHLTLPGARPSDLFEEDWIETSSMLASESLAAIGSMTSDEAAERVGASVARDIGLRNLSRWPASEQRAYRQLAPIVAATKPAQWPGEAKKSMRALLRAKGGSHEADYARLLAENHYFLKVLRKICRKTVHANSG